MTSEEYLKASCYWDNKDKESIKLDKSRLSEAIENYILSNNTCALATGTGDYVRCTPIEYSYHNGCFWMFSEGGKKFIGLSENSNVCLAIFDKFQGFTNLYGMQVMGKAEIIEPFSEKYMAYAEFKKISPEFLKKLKSPMYLICIHPERIDYLCSDFRKLNCSSRQTLILTDDKNDQ